MTTETTKSTEPVKYNNPTPVAVLLIPVVEKKGVRVGEEYHYLNVTSLLYIIRAIEPKKGMLAMPGGFVDEQESIEIAAARECEEEVGIVLSADQMKLYKSEITPGNQVLIFCTTPEFKPDILNQCKDNNEVGGFKIGNTHETFAFPLHKKVAEKFLNEENLKNISFLGANQEAAVKELKKMGYFSEDFKFEQSRKFRM